MTVQPTVAPFTASDSYETVQTVTLTAPCDFRYVERYGSKRTFRIGKVTFTFGRNRGVTGTWTGWGVTTTLGDTANVKKDDTLGQMRLTERRFGRMDSSGLLTPELVEHLGDLFAAAVEERDRIAELTEQAAADNLALRGYRA